MFNTVVNQYVPDEVSPPGETLLELLEERSMSQAELAERTGRPKKTINEIIKGKAPITTDTALQFERVLNTPASFWNQREQNYREWLARIQERNELKEYIPWMKNFPLRAMINLGWIVEGGDPINQLEILLNYLGVASPVQWQRVYEDAQWRQSPTFAADPAAVSAWLRQGEIQSYEIQCTPYDEGRFREALHKIRGLTTFPPEGFVEPMIQICSQVGVALVFVPEIPGTRTCGATRWLSPTKALIMLSLRYKTDDHLWFTFFHEAAHLLLHGKREVFIEDDKELSEDLRVKEEEADRYAAEFLIPEEELRQFYPDTAHLSHEDIIAFANRLGIAPGIVIGRLQRDGIIPYQNFNHLKRRFQLSKDEIN